jgi:hypothetical protein
MPSFIAALRSLTTTLLLAATVPACTGAPPAGDAAATDGGSNCIATTEAIQRDILVIHCGQSGCHGTTRPGLGLDLVSPGLESRLNGAPSVACPGERLVIGGDPEHSQLYRRLADEMPSCGARMPLGRDPLGADKLECIRAWIAALPLVDADAGIDAGADAGIDAGGCPAGQTLCGGRCVDTRSDPANCGTCGNVCTGGQVCSAGACMRGSCPTGTTDCSGACVDTQTSVTNCGACGRACPAGQACVSGRCVCTSGTTLCGGTCVNTATDPANCGACGRACSAGTMCSGGSCVSCGAMVSFGGQVQPIFNANCTTGCHGGMRPSAGLSLVADASYRNLVGVRSSCSDGRLRVAPGSPSTS